MFNRDLMLLGVGRLVAALLAIVAMRVSTNLLGPELYGELALLVAVQTFCGLFLINPVAQHINLHTHAWWNEGSLGARLKSYRVYVLVVALLGAAITLFISFHQSPIQLTLTTIAALLIVAAGTWNATLLWILNMLGFRLQFVFWSIITLAIALISAVVLVTLWQSATAWLVGQAIGMFVGAIGARSVLYRHSQYLRLSGVDIFLLDKKTIFAYCIPLSIATGMMWMQMSGYRFVINAYWGLAPLGFMVAGLQVANQIFVLVESIFSQFLHPMFYSKISGQPNESLKSYAYSDLLNILAPLYLLLAGLVVMSAPYLLKLLVSSQFHDVINYVMLGVVIELCRVFGNLFSNAAQATRKTSSLAGPYAVGAATTFALIFLVGVLELSIFMGGVAVAIGASAMVAVMWWRMSRQITLTIDLFRWLLATLAMFTMSILSIWLPKEVDILEAFAILMMVSMCAGVIGMTLLWKNPSVSRLLNVKLRKG